MNVDMLTDGPLPTWSEFAARLNAYITERDGEWCGLPFPLPGAKLVVEDRYPRRADLLKLQQIVDSGEPDPPARACGGDALRWHEVNRWRGRTKEGAPGDIVVIRHEDGRTQWFLDPEAPARNGFLLGAMSTLDAWSLETELTAVDRLATLLTERMFKCWVLTSSFLETSKRSGLTYFFRRCRPTVVLTPHKDPAQMQILACLCLHPLAFYAGTFCGAMVPTDDAIAHLLLLRGDEPRLWKMANQHHPVSARSGL